MSRISHFLIIMFVRPVDALNLQNNLRLSATWDDQAVVRADVRRLVVAMGTIPSRDCSQALASILNQSRIPDKVYLTLPKYSLLEQHWSGPLKKNVQDIVDAFGDRVQLLQPEKDEGPVSKYLFVLRQEVDPGTVVLIVDDDWMYPPNFVFEFESALEAHLHRQRSEVAVGGSGTWLCNNFSRHSIQRGNVSLPCSQQFAHVGETLTFGYGLPRECFFDVDVLQGAFGIAFRRGAVDLERLMTLINKIPPFLRFSADDMVLASHFKERGIASVLFGAPVPELLPESKVNGMNGHVARCHGDPPGKKTQPDCA